MDSIFLTVALTFLKLFVTTKKAYVVANIKIT